MSFYRQLQTMEVSAATKGLIVLLVDQSACHGAPPTADRANTFLQNVTLHCSATEGLHDWFDVAVLGYRSRDDGTAVVEPILNGSLAGREIVSIAELANPGRIESTSHTIPDDDTGELISLPVLHPVWVEHCACGDGPLGVALLRATMLIDQWIPGHRNSPPPFVINLTTGVFGGAGPEPYAAKLKQRMTTLGNVVLCHAVHAPGVMWPSEATAVLSCLPRLFQMSSGPLPQALRNSLRLYTAAQVSAESRCFSLNDDRMILDLVRGLAPGTRLPNLENIEENMMIDESVTGGNQRSYFPPPGRGAS